jgi:rhodanese-related sulfurtransferase
MFRKIALEALLIFGLASLLAMIVNGLRPEGIRPFESAAPRPGSAAALTGEASISIDEAIALFQSGQALFVDARSPAEFALGHVAGACNLPDDLFDEKFGDFLDVAPPGTLIITYCSGIDCRLAESLAAKLHSVGYPQTRYLTDGWGQWQMRQMPVATSAP